MLNKIIDIYKDKLIKSTQELIAIPSKKAEPKEGMPFGEEINRALVYALKRGEELGFLVGNVDGYAGFIEFGQGSETLGILAHLDVVPEGEGWTYPPFGGEIHDNKIYGRGAIDDKGPAMAA
ncbi:MAG: M20/M25/M40 family metallo-hydrolase, partial [Caldicoprobacterales bacterium]